MRCSLDGEAALHAGRGVVWLALIGCAAEEPAPTAHAPRGLYTSPLCEGIATPLADPPSFYEDNPTLPDANDSGAGLRHAAPEDVGLDGEVLAGAVAELEARSYVHSVIVARHGQIVLEEYLHGSGPQASNAVHSSSKSMLSLAVGVAVGEGAMRLDQPVAELLPDLFDGAAESTRSITVEHLLTMSAGFEWREDVDEYRLQREPDWLAAIVDLPMATTPGSAFNYSTAQTHLLGAALAHATGESLCDVVHSRLLTPVGARAERWGRDPQGYFSGGYNVTMTPRELYRFGQLVLDRGVWEGEQVVDGAWVDAAVSEQIADAGAYWYGYGFWLYRPPGYALDIAWGYGGQLVYTLREQDLVVVITTNTQDFAPDYDGGALVLEHVVGAIVDG